MTNRPIGISIIACLLILYGLVTPIYSYVFGAYQAGSIFDNAVHNLNWAASLIIGYGLFQCKKWAWYLSAIFLIINAAIALYELTHIQSVLQSLGLGRAAVIQYSLKFIGIIIAQIMVVSYLFRKVILVFYGFDTSTQLKKIVAVLGLSGVVLSVVYFL